MKKTFLFCAHSFDLQFERRVHYPYEAQRRAYITIINQSEASSLALLVRETGLSSQLSKAPPELSPNRGTYCAALGVRFKSRYRMKNTKYPNGYLVFLVRETGLEPVRVSPHAPQTCASADSATLASAIRIISNHNIIVNTFFKFF